MTHFPNLEQLLNSDDFNGTIIDLDNFIGNLCAYGDELENLSEPQKLFYLVQNLEREVNNGGFEQYFYNSSGDNAQETLSALAEIGAHRTLNILQLAINEFPNQVVPVDREERQNILDSLENASAAWDLLDQKFFLYEDDLNGLNIQFIKKNKAFF
jgi:hypothetical protein